MSKPLKQIHLAAHFPGVNNTTVWSDPAAGSHIEFSSFAHFARTAERAKFDFLFLAEGLRLREQGGKIYDLDVVGRPDTFTLAAALFWTTLGSVVGALVMYYLGMAFGRDRMYWVWERLPLVKTEDLEKTEAWFARHGTKAVFFGRMVPIFRSLISVPAGIERMNVGTFLLLTTAGSVIWNTVFVLLGYTLGENWPRIEPYASTFQKVVIATVVLGLAWFAVVVYTLTWKASSRAVASGAKRRANVATPVAPAPAPDQVTTNPPSAIAPTRGYR